MGLFMWLIVLLAIAWGLADFMLDKARRQAPPPAPPATAVPAAPPRTAAPADNDAAAIPSAPPASADSSPPADAAADKATDTQRP